MLLLIEVNYGQSIERRIFISWPVETTDLYKYANKMFKNNCFIDLEEGKLCLSFLLAVISKKKCLRPMYFLIKIKSHCVWVACKLPSKQAVAILSLISDNVQ